MHPPLLLALMLTTATAIAQGPPRLESSGGAWLELVGLPAVLDVEQVASQLLKGLTTTFVFRVEIPGLRSKSVGGARVEIRYELWDEIFEIDEIGADGRPERHKVDSEEGLRAWWGSLRLTILDRSLTGAGTGRARVVLEVIPFSRAEEADTQRWFSESVHRAELGKAGTSAPITEKKGSGGGVLDMLIATSIRRRPLMTFRWDVDLPGAASP